MQQSNLDIGKKKKHYKQTADRQAGVLACLVDYSLVYVIAYCKRIYCEKNELGFSRKWTKTAPL